MQRTRSAVMAITSGEGLMSVEMKLSGSVQAMVLLGQVVVLILEKDDLMRVQQVTRDLGRSTDSAGWSRKSIVGRRHRHGVSEAESLLCCKLAAMNPEDI